MEVGDGGTGGGCWIEEGVAARRLYGFDLGFPTRSSCTLPGAARGERALFLLFIPLFCSVLSKKVRSHIAVVRFLFSWPPGSIIDLGSFAGQFLYRTLAAP
jgi:hypothetical protein